MQTWYKDQHTDTRRDTLMDMCIETETLAPLMLQHLTKCFSSVLEHVGRTDSTFVGSHGSVIRQPPDTT